VIRTRLCGLLAIEIPVIQAGMGPFTSAQLVAAVSNAGGLGSLGAGARSIADLARELSLIRALTSKPFAVNHTTPTLDEAAFALTLEARPAVISFALGDPAPWVGRCHEAGILVMHQVTTVEQARQATAAGVDILNAQGSEAGGFGGFVSTLVLLPQVLDVAGTTPVVASGGIADGRGVAAALTLGAQGVNVGTRFLASVEAPISATWKDHILQAESEDTLKVNVWGAIFPLRPGDYPIAPRSLRSPFIDAWNGRPDEAHQQAERLRAEVGGAIVQGTFGELFPFAGESVGLVHDLLPAGDLLRRLATEAEDALATGRSVLTG
jgi:enoyl-[acyl-carrier protein] reductase II